MDSIGSEALRASSRAHARWASACLSKASSPGHPGVKPADARDGARPFFGGPLSETGCRAGCRPRRRKCFRAVIFLGKAAGRLPFFIAGHPQARRVDDNIPPPGGGFKRLQAASVDFDSREMRFHLLRQRYGFLRRAISNLDVRGPGLRELDGDRPRGSPCAQKEASLPFWGDARFLFQGPEPSPSRRCCGP